MFAVNPRSEEEARSFIDASDFVWHQRFELVPGVETPGANGIASLLDVARVPSDLRGRAALDIGTANGGAAFLLERAGADPVVAVDVYPEDWFGFRSLHSFLGSRVEYAQGSVYELDRIARGRRFDLVLFWGVLYHLRHPLLALDQIRGAVAAAAAVSIETAICDNELEAKADSAYARFYRRGELCADSSNWFAPTLECLEDWCVSSGLEPTSKTVWGEGRGTRCMMVCRSSEPEYSHVSYEVPLRVVPSRQSAPSAQHHVGEHRRLVEEVLDDQVLLGRFAEGASLPAGYGVGLDERVVEFPWLLSRGVRGRVLDAGSALNHEHILARVLPSVDELHVVTLEPEDQAFPEKRVSYVYGDLRELPYRDGWFDTVVCLSTLGHVGMDNTLYGVAEPRAADPDRELGRAADELVRVTAPTGRILVTVPYGRREDHGWFHQFDRRDVEALLGRLGGVHSIAVFRYGEDGWQVSDLDGAADSRYRDFLADPSPVPDRAAAARAVACVSVALQSARS